MIAPFMTRKLISEFIKENKRSPNKEEQLALQQKAVDTLIKNNSVYGICPMYQTTTPMEENKMAKDLSTIYIGVLNYRDYSFKLFEVECNDICNFNAEDWLNDNEELTGYRETDCYWISSETPIRYEFIPNWVVSTKKKKNR